MIKVNEALKTVLACVNILGCEKVKLKQALDRVLAEDIYADINIPLLDNTAMDGYAVRAFDTKGALKSNPKILEVIQDLRAGYLSTKAIKKNQAIRIMTGAPIPNGADSVVIVEETEKEGKNKVRIFKEVNPGENIRKSGSDIKNGELVISRGILLNPAHIGLLASLGKAGIKVTRKPKVGILATGDEIVDIKKPLAPGKVRSSNTYTLYSQVIKCGGIPKNLGIAKDRPKELEKKIKKGFDCDIILTSGGVSVGDYDFVKIILTKVGADIKFWKVAMKPGKPLVFGLIKKKIAVFGLPGNPVSSMVGFEIFVRLAILKMLGQNTDNRKEVGAILEEDITKKKDIRCFLRAQTRWEKGAYFTRLSGSQDSAVLKSMALANSLIILPEEKYFFQKGAKVTVRFLFYI